MEIWEQWKTPWQHAFFAAALGLTTLGAVTSGGSTAHPVVQAALAGALGGWYGFWFVGRRDTTPAHLPYLLGSAALWASMAAVDPGMLWVGAVSLIPYATRHLGWAVAGVIGALGAAWLWHGLFTDKGLDWSRVLGCALGILAVVAIAGYITMLEGEARKRQRVLDELAAAQAELAATERQAGVLAERQRLARDIHDTLTQGFASISMLLDAALADLPPNGPAPHRVSLAMRTVRENLLESRRLVEAPRPAQLEGTHFADAVGRLTQRLADDTGISASSVVSGAPAVLDPIAEGELLRVVQEALTNVRRHANAHQVTVTISYLNDVVVIDVQDDGSGFSEGAAPAGVGLAAMRERLDELGGSLTIESAPGEGTTIAATLPTHTIAQSAQLANADQPLVSS